MSPRYTGKECKKLFEFSFNVRTKQTGKNENRIPFACSMALSSARQMHVILIRIKSKSFPKKNPLSSLVHSLLFTFYGFNHFFLFCCCSYFASISHFHFSEWKFWCHISSGLDDGRAKLCENQSEWMCALSSNVLLIALVSFRLSAFFFGPFYSLCRTQTSTLL